MASHSKAWAQTRPWRKGRAEDALDGGFQTVGGSVVKRDDNDALPCTSRTLAPGMRAPDHRSPARITRKAANPPLTRLLIFRRWTATGVMMELALFLGPFASTGGAAMAWSVARRNPGPCGFAQG